jgi:serine/threonine protein kinase
VTDTETGEDYAVKVMLASEEPAASRSADRRQGGDAMFQTAVSRTVNEVCNLAAVKEHASVVELKEVFVEEETWFVVTTLLEGTELQHVVAEQGSCREEETKEVFRQILSGIAHLHAHGIVHRDIKLENILVSQSLDGSLTIRIVDFGLSGNVQPGQRLTQVCGTPRCVAPEVVSRNVSYGPEVDLWSAGVVLYTLLSGNTPFHQSDMTLLMKTILAGDFSLEDPIWSQVSNEAKNLLCGLLTVNPCYRLTAAEALMHPWLS